MNKRELTAFANKIGIEFNDLDKFKTALTHRSYLNEIDDSDQRHNERLEFLGDAVLELIVSEYLFETYSDRPEGELTSFRAATVKTESLAAASREMGVGDHLMMSKGEESTGGRDKDYLLANAFEAILGSIYVDQGYQKCKEFVVRWLLHKIDNIVENRLDIDAKTKFQELAQSLFRSTPIYKVLNEEGPDHEKIFTMAVVVDGQVFGEGVGTSKQKAEEQAAAHAIQQLHKKRKIARIA